MLNYYWSVNSSYNDGCNCHPEYHEVVADEEFLAQLAKYVVREECKQWSPNREDFTVRRPFTDAEWAQFQDHLAQARIDLVATQELEKQQRAKTARKAAVADALARAKAGLLVFEHELTPQSIAARRQSIADLQKEFDSL